MQTAMLTKFGNPSKDQVIRHESAYSEFVSYGTTIARKFTDGSIQLDENYWDYSATTGNYRNKFLGEGIADTRKAIERGDYTLTDLN